MYKMACTIVVSSRHKSYRLNTDPEDNILRDQVSPSAFLAKVSRSCDRSVRYFLPVTHIVHYPCMSLGYLCRPKGLYCHPKSNLVLNIVILYGLLYDFSLSMAIFYLIFLISALSSDLRIFLVSYCCLFKLWLHLDMEVGTQ